MQARSRHRYQRKRLGRAALRTVVNAVVLRRRTRRLSIPDRNWTRGVRLDQHSPNGFAHQLRNASSRARSSLAKRPELFLWQVDLSFLHVCQDSLATDIRQPWDIA